MVRKLPVPKLTLSHAFIVSDPVSTCEKEKHASSCDRHVPSDGHAIVERVLAASETDAG